MTILKQSMNHNGIEIINGTLHRFQNGARANRFLMIGEVKNKTVIICEGVGTGEIIHRATGHAVVIAFEYNLLSVTGVIRTKCPDMTIIIAADDDYDTEDNPSMQEATEVALYFSCLLAVPKFLTHRNKIDFYDMALEQGLDAVRVCIEAAGLAEEWRSEP